MVVVRLCGSAKPLFPNSNPLRNRRRHRFMPHFQRGMAIPRWNSDSSWWIQVEWRFRRWIQVEPKSCSRLSRLDWWQFYIVSLLGQHLDPSKVQLATTLMTWSDVTDTCSVVFAHALLGTLRNNYRQWLSKNHCRHVIMWSDVTNCNLFIQRAESVMTWRMKVQNIFTQSCPYLFFFEMTWSRILRLVFNCTANRFLKCRFVANIHEYRGGHWATEGHWWPMRKVGVARARWGL